MKEFTALDVERDFGAVMDEALSGPVRVVRGEEAVVVMPMERFERLRQAGWHRLFATMDEMAAEAKAAGLTDEVLANLLADES